MNCFYLIFLGHVAFWPLSYKSCSKANQRDVLRHCEATAFSIRCVDLLRAQQDQPHCPTDISKIHLHDSNPFYSIFL